MLHYFMQLRNDFKGIIKGRWRIVPIKTFLRKIIDFFRNECYTNDERVDSIHMGGGQMLTALDYAKYFIRQGLDTNPNTYDGNMKLQKLLFFANLISIAKRGEPLFDDPIMAFANGCVVESVRLKYKNNYQDLLKESRSFEPSLTQEEYDILNLTSEIFGHLSAKELSNLNHGFDFWKSAYNRSQCSDGFKDKEQSIIPNAEMQSEIEKIKSVIEQYKILKNERAFKEIVNGVVFYYSPENISMTDDIFEQLYAFSQNADEDVYNIYSDNGKLVIY